MANFDVNAIIRGAQLTFVGAHRALQNPGLFTSEHYRQAMLAVAAGILIRVIVAVPGIGLRVLLWFLSLFINLKETNWDDEILDGLHFIENNVLQVPFFLMSLMRYVTPTLDEMFMDSLNWVDRTYVQKHKADDPRNLRAMYYPNLKQYPARGGSASTGEKAPWDGAIAFLIRYGRKAGLSLAVWALSHLPYVGRFVLPAASFYAFKSSVGTQPAMVIFGSAVFLPKRWLVTFLQTYFASRSLMRELLEPYFSRVHFTKEQKRRWFKDREGVLFGFATAFVVMLRIPLLGVLIYGIAEASTAYLITKITDPPPPAAEAQSFPESQVRWKNKHEFLSLPLDKLDAHNIITSKEEQNPIRSSTPSRRFS